MKKKLILAIFIILAVSGFIFFRSVYNPTTENISQNQIEVSIIINGSEPIDKDMAEGTTALELLREAVEVETKGEGISAYVTSIDGLEAEESKKEFWSMYVNGKMASVGAGSYILKNGDIIEWKIENY